MASLFKALSNWWRAKKDQAAEAIQDPIRDGKFAIEDSEKKIKEFQSKIVKFMAINRQLEREINNQQVEVNKWSGIAHKAAASGNMDDVTQAVEAKQQAQSVLDEKSSQHSKNAEIVHQLRKQLQIAAAKVARAKSNYSQLVARHQGAMVRKELAQAANEFGGDGPLAELDDLQKAVDAEETEAEAFEELACATQGSENLFEKYGSNSSATVQDEVARLMAQAKQKD